MIRASKAIVAQTIAASSTLPFTLLLIAYYTISPGNNLPFPLKDLARANTLKSILTFQPQYPSCKIATPQPLPNTPVVNSLNPLPTTYSQTRGQIAYPVCDNGCQIVISDEGGFEVARFPAPNPADPGNPIKELSNLFFDTKNQIISYQITPDTRVVVNFAGKLLHWIDESPGLIGQLTLKYYQPESDTLVYEDQKGNIYHYRATATGLWINPCPPLTTATEESAPVLDKR